MGLEQSCQEFFFLNLHGNLFAQPTVLSLSLTTLCKVGKPNNNSLLCKKMTNSIWKKEKITLNGPATNPRNTAPAIQGLTILTSLSYQRYRLSGYVPALTTPLTCILTFSQVFFVIFSGKTRRQNSVVFSAMVLGMYVFMTSILWDKWRYSAGMWLADR